MLIKSAYVCITVGETPGPFGKAETTTPPMDAMPWARADWSISLVNTPGETMRSSGVKLPVFVSSAICVFSYKGCNDKKSMYKYGPENQNHENVRKSPTA